MDAEKQVSFNDFIDLISGGTPKTNIPEYWGGTIPWLSVTDFNTGYRWVSTAEKWITERGLAESATNILNQGDIIISARGTVGVVAQLAVPMAFNQSCYGIRGKKGIADTNFVYYALRHAVVQMQQVAHGGVFNTITRDTFKIIKTRLPSPNEQQAIAHILGTLDDKIELNRRMNKTLEEMARALFKSWFVDFDPVRAKETVRDEHHDWTNAQVSRAALPKLNPEIAELFPDSFEGSELGEIPKGWAVETVGNICEFAYGKALKADQRQPGRVLVMGSNGQVGTHNEALVKGPGIVVGRKGNPGIVTWVNSDFFPIDTTFYVVPKRLEYPLTFLLHALENLNLASLGADSAVPGLNRNIAYRSQLIIPDNKILKAFEIYATTTHNRQGMSEKEIHDLTALRDTLLPKLISGELRMKDTENFLEKRRVS